MPKALIISELKGVRLKGQFCWFPNAMNSQLTHEGKKNYLPTVHNTNQYVQQFRKSIQNTLKSSKDLFTHNYLKRINTWLLQMNRYQVLSGRKW